MFKLKGEMVDPTKYRPLCNLSHVRKVIEKAAVSEMKDIVEIDQAQFGSRKESKLSRQS